MQLTANELPLVSWRARSILPKGCNISPWYGTPVCVVSLVGAAHWNSHLPGSWTYLFASASTFGLWHLAVGTWPVAFGLWPLACDSWPLALGVRLFSDPHPSRHLWRHQWRHLWRHLRQPFRAPVAAPVVALLGAPPAASMAAPLATPRGTCGSISGGARGGIGGSTYCCHLGHPKNVQAAPMRQPMRQLMRHP